MKIETRTLYLGDGRQLWFARVANTPGFSHRVIIDGVAVDWLASDHRPNKQAAAYFLAKHAG